MRTQWVDTIDKPKVFCIGPYKSGTTSLHSFFESYDLKSYHGPAWVDWCSSGNLGRLDEYDCLSDGMKHPLEFLYERYPEAKFIYTKRSLRGWMISRYKHRRRNCWRWRYYCLILIGRKTFGGLRYDNRELRRWPQEYYNHEKRAFDFFKDKRGKLLVVDMFEQPPEEVGRQIHDFLKLPGKPHSLRRKNVAPNRDRKRSEQAVDRILKELAFDFTECG